MDNLENRLEYCANKVGGKRALSKLTQISESQLYRYFKLKTELPLSRAILIAECVMVDFNWLAKGTGNSDRPYIPVTRDRADILRKTICALETTLLEYNGTISPSQKSYLIPLLTINAENELNLRGRMIYENRFDIFSVIYFMECCKDVESLELQLKTLIQLELNTKTFVKEELDMYISLICSAFAKYYSSYMGEKYYERASYPLNEYNVKMVCATMDAFFRYSGTNKKIKLLDHGCGNGRHLRYFNEHYPQIIDLKGIDASKLAAKHIQKLEYLKVLPANTFKYSDIQELPFENGTFNMIHSMGVIRCVPLLEGSTKGAQRVFSEAFRVLESKGVFSINTLYGEGLRYFPFEQYYNEETLKNMAEKVGFRVLEIAKHEIPTNPNAAPSVQVPVGYRGRITAILQKP